MKKSLVLLSFVAIAALAALQGGGAGNPAQDPPAQPAEVETGVAGGVPVDDSDDVLAETLKLNSELYPPPPEPTRKGHVKPRPLAADAIRRQAGGFEVKLPRGALVTTPAVYGGNVLVSGGFRSREYYAVDAATGEPVWGLSLDDDGPSTAACVRGICAFNTESCTLFAVDADTGGLLWSWWLGDPLMSAPSIAGDKVFTTYPVPGWRPAGQVPRGKPTQVRPAEASHAVAAFELRTGRVLWQRWIDGDAISAPVAADGELIVATFGGTVYRFAQADGRILSARRERATSAPIVDGEEMYFSRRLESEGEAATEGLLRKRKDGIQRWLTERKRAAYLEREIQKRSKMWKDGLELDAGNGFGGGAPATSKAEIAAANVGQGSVSTLQAFQGSRVVKSGDWTYSTMGEEVVCASAVDGKRKWAYKLSGDLEAEGGALASPPIPAGDALLVATVAGEVLLLDADDGRVRRRWSLGHRVRSQPVVEDGWIYAGTEDGLLVALDTGDRSLTGWPMWGGGAGRNG